MSNDTQIIVDSDAFVGLFWEHDALHQPAMEMFQQLKSENMQLTTTSAVVSETATVLSHRKDQDLARKFLNDFIAGNNFPVIWVDENLYAEGLELFMEQTKKGTSFTDCVNALLCQQLEMSHIFSFDKVYPKSFNIALATVPENIG